MSVAGQKFSFDFYTDFRAKNVNAFGYRVLPKGVYACPTALEVVGGSITLPIGLVLYMHSLVAGTPPIQVGVRVELTETATVVASAPWICASLTWTEDQLNEVVFAAKTLAQIQEDDVVLCRVETVNSVTQTTVDSLAQTVPAFQPPQWVVRPVGYTNAGVGNEKVTVNSLTRVIGHTVVTAAAQELAIPVKPVSGVRYDAIILRVTGTLEVVSGPTVTNFSSAATAFWNADSNNGLPQGSVLALIKRDSTRAASDVLAADIIEIGDTQLVDPDLTRYIHADKSLYVHGTQSSRDLYIDSDLLKYVHADHKNYLLPKLERYLYDPFPVGTVVMFNGAQWKNTVGQADAMPGWAVCDGNVPEGGYDATPNMIDRFSRGRANNTAGVSDSGSSVVTLVTANLPAHSHVMTHGHANNTAALAITGGNHRHWMFANVTGNGRLGNKPDYPVAVLHAPTSSVNAYDMDASDSAYANIILGATSTDRTSVVNGSTPAGAQLEHSHGISWQQPVVNNMTGNTQDSGGGQSFTVLPPWRSFIYVIKYKDNLYPA